MMKFNLHSNFIVPQSPGTTLCRGGYTLTRHQTVTLALSCAIALSPMAQAGDYPQHDHVLLISIDGMHAVDYENCVKNNTCPNLAALGETESITRALPRRVRPIRSLG